MVPEGSRRGPLKGSRCQRACDQAQRRDPFTKESVEQRLTGRIRCVGYYRETASHDRTLHDCQLQRLADIRGNRLMSSIGQNGQGNRPRPWS